MNINNCFFCLSENNCPKKIVGKYCCTKCIIQLDKINNKEQNIKLDVQFILSDCHSDLAYQKQNNLKSILEYENLVEKILHKRSNEDKKEIILFFKQFTYILKGNQIFIEKK